MESPAGLSGAYYNADGKNSPTDVKVECTSCACHMESAVKVNVTTSETLVSAEYSSFNFWKTPLPQVDDLELDSLTLEDKSVNSSSKTLHVHLTWSENKERKMEVVWIQRQQRTVRNKQRTLIHL